PPARGDLPPGGPARPPPRRRHLRLHPRRHGPPAVRVWRPGEGLASPPVEPDAQTLTTLLDQYQPGDDAEAADVRRLRTLVEDAGDPWRRDLPLHVTASALIVHPP